MLTNKTACQIEIQGLTTRVDIQSTLQASEVDHDQEAAEYIAKVGRVVSTLSEGILQTYEQVSLNLSIVSGLPVKYVIFWDDYDLEINTTREELGEVWNMSPPH